MPSTKRRASSRDTSPVSTTNAFNADSDYGGWHASDTPEESWSQYENSDGDGEWPVDNVVGEQVDLSGHKKYQIKWFNWHRADGSETTWQWTLPGQEGLIANWDKKQTRAKLDLAQKGQDISMTDISRLPHDVRTAEDNVAYQEKKRKYMSRPEPSLDWDAEIEDVKTKIRDLEDEQNRRRGGSSTTRFSPRVGRSDSPVLEGPAPAYRPRPASSRSSMTTPARSETQTSARCLRHKSTRQEIPTHSRREPPNLPVSTRSETTIPTRRDISTQSMRIASQLSLPSSIQTFKSPSTRTTSTAPPMSARRRSSSKRIRQGYSPSPSVSTHSSHSSSRLLRTRSTMEGEWNEEARRRRAAPVYIVNDVDDEEYPPVHYYFKYLENRYEHGQHVKRFREQLDFLIGCECSDRCSDPSTCACQEASGLVNDEDQKILAYDRKGLFLFNNHGREVIECNKHCTCDIQRCPNRVAQRSRDIPIEVFKTRDNGWGARATVDLPKGKVLGLYTGLLMTRSEADAIPADVKNYIFDLDTRDDDDNIPDSFLHSVHAEKTGNWTRFVNHSCDPTASVYSVVFQSAPEANTPYIAFVANQSIPARTEITIDYNPQHAKGVSHKGKKKLDPGKRVCLCGTEMCRGWM